MTKPPPPTATQTKKPKSQPTKQTHVPLQIIVKDFFFSVVKFKYFTPLRASEYDINIILCYVHCEKYNNIKLQVIPQRTEMEICSYIISYNVQFMGCKDRVMNWKLQVFNSSHIHKLFYSSEI